MTAQEAEPGQAEEAEPGQAQEAVPSRRRWTARHTVVAGVAAETITDPATLAELLALVDESDALLRDVTSLDAGIPDGAQAADIAAVAAFRDRLASATQQLGPAVKAVAGSHDAFLLGQAGKAFDTAVVDLSAQVEASQGVLDGSAGKVADDAVRQALAASLDAAGRRPERRGVRRPRP